MVLSDNDRGEVSARSTLSHVTPGFTCAAGLQVKLAVPIVAVVMWDVRLLVLQVVIMQRILQLGQRSFRRAAQLLCCLLDTQMSDKLTGKRCFCSQQRPRWERFALFFIEVVSNANCVSLFLSLKMKCIRLQRVKPHKVTSASYSVICCRPFLNAREISVSFYKNYTLSAKIWGCHMLQFSTPTACV